MEGNGLRAKGRSRPLVIGLQPGIWQFGSKRYDSKWAQPPNGRALERAQGSTARIAGEGSHQQQQQQQQQHITFNSRQALPPMQGGRSPAGASPTLGSKQLAAPARNGANSSAGTAVGMAAWGPQAPPASFHHQGHARGSGKGRPVLGPWAKQRGLQDIGAQQQLSLQDDDDELLIETNSNTSTATQGSGSSSLLSCGLQGWRILQEAPADAGVEAPPAHSLSTGGRAGPWGSAHNTHGMRRCLQEVLPSLQDFEDVFDTDPPAAPPAAAAPVPVAAGVADTHVMHVFDTAAAAATAGAGHDRLSMQEAFEQLPDPMLPSVRQFSKFDLMFTDRVVPLLATEAGDDVAPAAGAVVQPLAPAAGGAAAMAGATVPPLATAAGDVAAAAGAAQPVGEAVGGEADPGGRAAEAALAISEEQLQALRAKRSATMAFGSAAPAAAAAAAVGLSSSEHEEGLERPHKAAKVQAQQNSNTSSSSKSNNSRRPSPRRAALAAARKLRQQQQEGRRVCALLDGHVQVKGPCAQAGIKGQGAPGSLRRRSSTSSSSSSGSSTCTLGLHPGAFAALRGAAPAAAAAPSGGAAGTNPWPVCLQQQQQEQQQQQQQLRLHHWQALLQLQQRQQQVLQLLQQQALLRIMGSGSTNGSLLHAGRCAAVPVPAATPAPAAAHPACGAGSMMPGVPGAPPTAFPGMAAPIWLPGRPMPPLFIPQQPPAADDSDDDSDDDDDSDGEGLAAADMALAAANAALAAAAAAAAATAGVRLRPGSIIPLVDLPGQLPQGAGGAPAGTRPLKRTAVAAGLLQVADGVADGTATGPQRAYKKKPRAAGPY